MNKLQGKMIVVEGKEAEVAHSASTLHQQVTRMEFDQILINIWPKSNKNVILSDLDQIRNKG